MEYQKIANLLDTESNQPSKFRNKEIDLKQMMNQGEHILITILDLKIQC